MRMYYHDKNNRKFLSIHFDHSPLPSYWTDRQEIILGEVDMVVGKLVRKQEGTQLLASRQPQRDKSDMLAQ